MAIKKRLLRWFRHARHRRDHYTTPPTPIPEANVVPDAVRGTTTTVDYVRLGADGSVRLVPSAMVVGSDTTTTTRDHMHRAVLDRAAEFGPLRVFVDLSECSLRALDTSYYTHLAGWVKREYRDRLQTLTIGCPHKRHLWIVCLMRQLLGSGTRSKIRIVRNLSDDDMQTTTTTTTTKPQQQQPGTSERSTRATLVRFARAACVVWIARHFPRATWFGLVMDVIRC